MKKAYGQIIYHINGLPVSREQYVAYHKNAQRSKNLAELKEISQAKTGAKAKAKAEKKSTPADQPKKQLANSTQAVSANTVNEE